MATSVNITGRLSAVAATKAKQKQNEQNQNSKHQKSMIASS
jgi:hypothetical protein